MVAYAVAYVLYVHNQQLVVMNTILKGGYEFISLTSDTVLYGRQLSGIFALLVCWVSSKASIPYNPVW